MAHAYRPFQHYPMRITPAEAHLWLVIKNIDGQELGNGDGIGMMRLFLGVNIRIVRILVLRNKDPMTILAKFESEDLKYSVMYAIDGKQYGRRLLNALNYKSSDSAEVVHRTERFDPTPFQAERTVTIRNILHATMQN